LERIRQWSDVPILFLTARSTDLDKLNGFALGADDYMTKPFNPLEVAARMKAHLKRYKPAKDQRNDRFIYDYGRFQVNELAGELIVEGKAVPCPAQVFQLLLFFCKHPNRVFNKQELYRKGRSPSRTPKGTLRRRFRLFADVILSLQHLTQTLRHNEEMRRQLEQTREEWIAGVSHDLKTPLSSIKGYSHMLAAEQYRWTEEEVREFSGIILEKANYMETLIDDLSLTYRLKNKKLCTWT
jgi:signal transduction histidine kinase